jgi:hypothetical protein
MPQIEIPPLPQGVDLSQVYSEFMKYLYDHTRGFFIESTPNGKNIWARLESKIILLFCHPNGWDVSQQGFLAECAARAGMIRPDEISTRVEFVTEGEASVHYALAYTPSAAWLRTGSKFLVVDAGGSTIDSNFYECSSTTPLKLKEVHRSECIQVGFIYLLMKFVDFHLFLGRWCIRGSCGSEITRKKARRVCQVRLRRDYR